MSLIRAICDAYIKCVSFKAMESGSLKAEQIPCWNTQLQQTKLVLKNANDPALFLFSEFYRVRILFQLVNFELLIYITWAYAMHSFIITSVLAIINARSRSETIKLKNLGSVIERGMQRALQKPQSLFFNYLEISSIIFTKLNSNWRLPFGFLSWNDFSRIID